MFKKILIVLMIFFLCSCEKKEEVKEDYIDPVRDIFIFDEIDEDLQTKIKKANLNKDFENYQFKMLFKDVYGGDVKDINDNTINFTDYEKLIIEVVSVNCSHCRKQLHEIDNMVNSFDGYFIQYFNVGSKQEVLDLYEEENVEINENVIIVLRNEDFLDYLKNYLNIEGYPTLLSFNNYQLSFVVLGEMNEETFDDYLNISFEDTLKYEDLLDENGNDIRKDSRSIDDVRNDLSDENLEKLRSIDNDKYSEELTLKLIGRNIDFNDLSGTKKDAYRSDIEDFSIYENSKLVVFYIGLNDEDEERIEFINSLTTNDEYEYLVFLIEGMNHSSMVLEDMDIDFNCKVVSNLGVIPDDLDNFGVVAYPTAIFIDKSTICGAYSNISDLETFNDALNMFLSEDSIAYKRNN